MWRTRMAKARFTSNLVLRQIIEVADAKYEIKITKFNMKTQKCAPSFKIGYLAIFRV